MHIKTIHYPLFVGIGVSCVHLSQNSNLCLVNMVELNGWLFHYQIGVLNKKLSYILLCLNNNWQNCLYSQKPRTVFAIKNREELLPLFLLLQMMKMTSPIPITFLIIHTIAYEQKNGFYVLHQLIHITSFQLFVLLFMPLHFFSYRTIQV